MSILDYIFYFFFYSFIGWFFESCYCSIRPKKWINRGFLRGPLCPIYGTGALVIMTLLIPLRELTPYLYLNEIIIFLVGMVVCDIVEYMTSFIMEKLFNARWWDYSNKKYNLHGRICLTHTLYWGAAACLFTFILHPIIDIFFVSQINPNSRHILVYIFLTVFVFDLLDTVINALGIRSTFSKFKVIYDEISDFAKYVETIIGDKIDHSAEETKTELLNRFNELGNKYDSFKDEASKKKTKTKQHLIKAFPFLKEGYTKQATQLENLLNDLKEKINNFINK